MIISIPAIFIFDFGIFLTVVFFAFSFYSIPGVKTGQFVLSGCYKRIITIKGEIPSFSTV
jgi:hypothetical protein